jgi:hypothetical protein
MRIAALMFALGATACITRVNTYGASASAGQPPLLPAGATVPMWDHYCAEPTGRKDALIKLLDEASANGWELVGMGFDNPTMLICFKRPHVTPASTEPPGKTPPAAPSS